MLNSFSRVSVYFVRLEFKEHISPNKILIKTKFFCILPLKLVKKIVHKRIFDEMMSIVCIFSPFIIEIMNRRDYFIFT